MAKLSDVDSVILTKAHGNTNLRLCLDGERLGPGEKDETGQFTAYFIAPPFLIQSVEAALNALPVSQNQEAPVQLRILRNHLSGAASLYFDDLSRAETDAGRWQGWKETKEKFLTNYASLTSRQRHIIEAELRAYPAYDAANPDVSPLVRAMQIKQLCKFLVTLLDGDDDAAKKAAFTGLIPVDTLLLLFNAGLPNNLQTKFTAAVTAAAPPSYEELFKAINDTIEAMVRVSDADYNDVTSRINPRNTKRTRVPKLSLAATSSAAMDDSDSDDDAGKKPKVAALATPRATPQPSVADLQAEVTRLSSMVNTLSANSPGGSRFPRGPAKQRNQPFTGRGYNQPSRAPTSGPTKKPPSPMVSAIAQRTGNFNTNRQGPRPTPGPTLHSYYQPANRTNPTAQTPPRNRPPKTAAWVQEMKTALNVRPQDEFPNIKLCFKCHRWGAHSHADCPYGAFRHEMSDLPRNPYPRSQADAARLLEADIAAHEARQASSQNQAPPQDF